MGLRNGQLYVPTQLHCSGNLGSEHMELIPEVIGKAQSFC